MCITPLILTRGIIYLLGYVIAVVLGSFLVSSILSKLELDEKQEKTLSGIKGAGNIIGMIERVLVTTFIYLNVPEAIAIVFAAKSIVRFESAKERHFAEYYLIGTMTSITLALLVGTLFAYMEKLIAS